MPIISNDEPRLSAVLDEAEDAFWGNITSNYPEATTGDLSPFESIKLSEAMHSAVVEWLQFNADSPPSPPKTVEILLHRIEYSHREWASLTITDSEVKHIAYCISEGISEGELNTEVPRVLPTKIAHGYWKINNNPE